MEEAKAAAYYDELSRKGEGAARFKQGLGYSAADAAAPSWRSSSSSSALLSGFVRASAGGKSDPDAAKEAQLSTVKAKLAGKSDAFQDPDRRSSRGSRRREERGRSRSGSRSRSPRRERAGRRRRKSRSSSPPERGRRKGRRSRSRSPSPWRRERSGRENREGHRSRPSRGKENGGSVDYSQLIDGYSNMVSLFLTSNKQAKKQFFLFFFHDLDPNSDYRGFDLIFIKFGLNCIVCCSIEMAFSFKGASLFNVLLLN